jgi:hypothetical protein
MDEPPICGNTIPGFQQNHVTGNQPICVHFIDSAATANLCSRRQHAPERSQTLLGAMLLIKAEQRIEDDDCEDDGPVLDVAGEGRE